MAMGKCVIVSGVAALSEIIGNRPIGLVHEKDSLNSLVACLKRVVEDKTLRDQLAANAHDFVVAERDWSVLGKHLVSLYEELAQNEDIEDGRRCRDQRTNYQ